MVSLNDLARQHTNLATAERAHLRRLTGSWSPLADLSFSDILLYLPVSVPELFSPKIVVVGQVRPSTAQTLFVEDLVGRTLNLEDVPIVAKVLDSERRVDEAESDTHGRERRLTAIPVNHGGRVLGVMVRHHRLRPTDVPSGLEQAYFAVSRRFDTMVADGTFPFPFEDAITEESPRVGDGALILDDQARVVYSSPNAVSALHRMGYHGRTTGSLVEEMGFDPDVVSSAYRLKVPVIDEVQRGERTTILARMLPLVDDGDVVAALVLVRDVSDLRRRDRMLVSMDATIREIHHRVKNNLQTVSSLLRIQGRRLESTEAKAAIDESVRRIAAIAVVHEMLASSGGDEVVFRDVLEPIIGTASSTLVSSEIPVRFQLLGHGTTLTASRASSLAVVVTELLQNAVEHGYPPGSDGGTVTVELLAAPGQLIVRVHDDGVGIPDDFDVERADGLGLTIIRSLVTGELGGTLTIRQAEAGHSGTLAQVAVDLTGDDSRS